MADGFPEGDKGLPADEAGAVASDSGTSDEEPGEEDEKEQRYDDGEGHPAGLDINGADLLAEGGERGDGGTGCKEERGWRKSSRSSTSRAFMTRRWA